MTQDIYRYCVLFVYNLLYREVSLDCHASPYINFFNFFLYIHCTFVQTKENTHCKQNSLAPRRIALTSGVFSKNCKYFNSGTRSSNFIQSCPCHHLFAYLQDTCLGHQFAVHAARLIMNYLSCIPNMLLGLKQLGFLLIN